MPRPALATLVSSAAVAAATAALAAPAGAQASGDGFLFSRPRATLTVRGGYDRPFARGAIFDDVVDRLTLDRSSFGAGAVNAELALALRPRLDLVVTGGFASSARGSEFRGFVDNDDLPITQTTTLTRAPVGAGLKAYLVPRGREVGRFAWIPARIAPFVGAGGGAVYYRFAQQGSFVAFNSLDVVDEQYRTSGWAPAGFGFAGADWSLSPRLVLSGEVRYTAARARPRESFDLYDRIDLSGAAATVGLGVRF
jgi:hypothetical protein